MGVLRDKKILITGAQGFIGTHLCRALQNDGALVASIDRTHSPTLCERSFIGDILDFPFVKNACTDFQPEYFFHLAAYKGRTACLKDFRQALDVNLTGTLNLIEALSPLKSLRMFVGIGTAEEYGLGCSPFKSIQREMPITSYSFSKVCMTHLLQTIHRLQDFPSVIIRPSIAYGPGQDTDMFLPALITSLLMNKEFKMTDGTQKRDFIYIDDLVEALILACSNKAGRGEIYNVGSSENIKIAELALKVSGILNRSHLIKIGELPGRKLDISEYCLDVGKMSAATGWFPRTSLDSGLEKTIKSFQKSVKS